MAVTNCFCENFMDILTFALIYYTFCSSMTKCPQHKIQLALHEV